MDQCAKIRQIHHMLRFIIIVDESSSHRQLLTFIVMFLCVTYRLVPSNTKNRVLLKQFTNCYMMSVYRETEKYQRTCDPSENLTEVAARGTLRPAETRRAIPGHYLVQ